MPQASGVYGVNAVLSTLDGLLPELETLYAHLHAHPELSFQETRTAGIAAERLRAATPRVVASFDRSFPADRVKEVEPTSGSEDFGCFGAQWHVPSVFRFVGGTDPEAYRKARAAGRMGELPTNHDPRFAPVLQPTLRAGVEAAAAAAQAWLAP